MRDREVQGGLWCQAVLRQHCSGRSTGRSSGSSRCREGKAAVMSARGERGVKGVKSTRGERRERGWRGLRSVRGVRGGDPGVREE